jgi:ribosomal protein S27AE
MPVNNRPRTCARCGDVATSATETASGRYVCGTCRLIQSLQQDIAPADECPRCRATKVLRTPSGKRDEILVCAHCDHIWSRVQA